MSQQDQSPEPTSSNRGKYGKWSVARKHQLIEATLEFRPFEQEKLKVKEARDKVKEAVNSIEPELGDVGDTSIKRWLEKIIAHYRKKQLQGTTFGTGTSFGDSVHERNTVNLYTLVKKSSKKKCKRKYTYLFF